MDFLYDKYRIDDFQFRDDIFTADKKRVKEFCSLLIKQNKRYLWNCYATFNTIDEGLIRLMKEAGCYQLNLGIETGSEESLKAYKGFSNSLVKGVMSVIKKVGIETRLFFIIGPPSITVQDVEDTIAFAIELDPTCVIFVPAAPYPGTAFYTQLLQRGYELPDFENHIFTENEPLCDLPGFSRKYLSKMTKTAYLRFYFRPQYLARRIMSIRSFCDLKSNFFEGLIPLLRFALGKDNSDAYL
jgi:radical SAM superfamily enzyme YgiQ (UPF0313 family)